MSEMTALLLGATGETGRELLKHLCDCGQYTKVILVGRRKVEDGPTSDKVEQRVVDFDNLDAHKKSFAGADVAFCCLGTTRGKAGKDGFVRVDYDYVVNSANILKDAGCKQFHLLTSKGSDPNSFFLYPATKGKAEEAVKALNFDRTSIYRPGLLMCERQEQRTGEKIFRALAGACDKSEKYSISTEKVAKAMLVNSLRGTSDKAETIEHGALTDMAKGSFVKDSAWTE